jgi:class 3 adenylate cyclase/Tfp pilus assembly protein PilF
MARAKRRLAAILAADVVGYSRLMGQDEPGTLERLKAHRQELIQPLVAAHRGRIVNLVGDSALCEFPSVVEAVACAVAVQEATTERERDRPEAERLRFRIGVNIGDVIAEGGDLYGDGVNVAARLEGLAEPGGICISGKVHEEVRGKLDGLAFEDLGERALKNIARPVRAWRVADAAAAPSRPVAAVLPFAEHNLPQPNPSFVGRAVELEALRQALTATGRGAITQSRRAISGLGGIGKTQLALAYAYAHLGEYDLIRWLRAEEPTALAADYAGLAPALGLDPGAPDRAALVAAIRGKLERAARWLLVFDNATEPGSLAAYLPRVGGGHVLVTSRWREWEGTAEALELEALPEPEAVVLLLGGEGDDPTERTAAAGLAQELGCLPLALAQARAFMRARQVGVAGYRQQLAAARPKVLAWRPPDAGYPLAVAQTWQASLDQATHDCPGAAELMRLLAFLAPDAVPRDLLGAAPEALPQGLRDPFDRDTAIEALGRFSLVRVEPASLTVHRLVQTVTRDGLDAASARSCAELAMRLIDTALPRPLSEHAHRPVVGRLLPHALAAAEAAERFEVGLATAGAILNDVGAYLRDGAARSEAEPLLRRALALRERVLGPDHPDLATSLDNLAQLYGATGRPAEAEPLYQRALAVRERALGPDHPRFAESLGCLGLFYLGIGRRAEAEPLIERALATYERTLGPDHPDLAYLLSHWAWLYHKPGRHAEAEPLYRRAIAAAEQALGPEHPHVATFLRKLAWLYQDAGRPAEAEPLYRRAITIRERTLGSEHRDLAQSLIDVAGFYIDTNRFPEAEPLLERALAITERALGPEHPDLTNSLTQLAWLYEKTGRPAEAEPLLRRAIAIKERAFGPEHPDLVYPLHHLAWFYRDTSRFAEAEPLYQRALALMERAFGPEHPDLAYPLHHLALIYRNTGRFAEAEPLLKRAIELERARGPEHPGIANLLNNLAGLYCIVGRFAEAEPVCEKAIAVVERVLGSEHVDLAHPLTQLAALYRDTGRVAEAEPLLERAIAIYERALGPEPLGLAWPLTHLAALHCKAGRFAEAEPLCKRAIAIYERVLVPEHHFLVGPLEHMGVIYRETGRCAEAELLFKRAIAIYERVTSCEHPGLAHCLHHLAMLYHNTGRPAEAEPSFRRSLEIMENVLPPNHPDLLIVLQDFTALLDRLGRGEEAAALHARADAIRQRREQR